VPGEKGLRIAFVAAAPGSQEKTIALPEVKDPVAEKKRKEDARHIDVRTKPETRQRFYGLYHKWVSGKDDKSMDAYMAFLLEQGEKAINSMAYRPHPFDA